MGVSPYVRLSPDRIEEDIEAQLDDDFAMLDASEISLVIDYPLRTPSHVELTADDGVTFKRDELLRKIGKAYEDIYAEEERTTTLPVQTMAERHPGCFLINRAETDGTYGIYAHVLSDLLLHKITYHPDTNELHLHIDS